MATVVDSRESILPLAARQRRRLAWRHLLPLALALLAMLVSVVGIGETIWPGFRDLVGDRPDTVSARWQVWAEVYVGASVLASLAATRFNVRLALQRLPLVIVLGAIGVAAFLVLWIGSRFLLARGDSSSQGGSPDAAPSADEEVSPRPRPPRNLAAALLTPAEAELVLGKRLAPPMTGGG